MVKFGTIARGFLKGRRRTGIFAITSRCNCRCAMCDIYRNEPTDVGLDEAIKILDFMANNGFLVAYFTGGEPSLHPNVVKIVKYADKHDLITSLTTNGTIRPEKLKELKKAGLHTLSVSVDSWDSEICEKVKGFRGIQERYKRTISFAKRLKMRIYSLTYLGPHITPENIDKMVNYVNENLGVPFALCYPATTNVNTYLLGNYINAPSPEDLKGIAQRLLELKKSGHRIANTASYLEEVIRFHDREPSKFPCKCGEYVFYIDWFGDVYPCFMKEKLFNVLEENPSKVDNSFLQNVRCNKCLIDCFREPSYLAYIRYPELFLKEIRYNFPLREIL